jgi:hypothetical protein
VAQAWRKGGPSVEWRKCFCLQQKLGKGRVGEKKQIAGIAKLGDCQN